MLWLNGRDVREQPLVDRKTALREINPKESPWVLYADFVETHRRDLFRAACESGTSRGSLPNGKDEPYAANVRWVKIKNPGYSQASGRQEQFQRRRAR